jgi:hypothetical protein
MIIALLSSEGNFSECEDLGTFNIEKGAGNKTIVYYVQGGPRMLFSDPRGF